MLNTAFNNLPALLHKLNLVTNPKILGCATTNRASYDTCLPGYEVVRNAAAAEITRANLSAHSTADARHLVSAALRHDSEVLKRLLTAKGVSSDAVALMQGYLTHPSQAVQTADWLINMKAWLQMPETYAPPSHPIDISGSRLCNAFNHLSLGINPGFRFGGASHADSTTTASCFERDGLLGITLKRGTQSKDIVLAVARLADFSRKIRAEFADYQTSLSPLMLAPLSPSDYSLQARFNMRSEIAECPPQSRILSQEGKVGLLADRSSFLTCTRSFDLRNALSPADLRKSTGDHQQRIAALFDPAETSVANIICPRKVAKGGFHSIALAPLTDNDRHTIANGDLPHMRGLVGYKNFGEQRRIGTVHVEHAGRKIRPIVVFE